MPSKDGRNMVSVRRLHRVWAAALLVAAAVAAQAADEYALRPGDTLSVLVMRHPELSADGVVVAPDGRINLPVVGELTVQGMTIRQVTSAITLRLRGRLVDPEVTVALRQFRPDQVFVLGAVKSSGAYPLQAGWRVTELLAAAGGLVADPRAVQSTLFRTSGASQPVSIELALADANGPENIALAPGDVLSLTAQTISITVTGAVARPGTYTIPADAGLVAAIAQAGGASPLARLGQVTVSSAGGTRATCDLTGPLLRGEPAPEVRLAMGDVVLVTTSEASVAILGVVRRPGSFPLEEDLGMRLSDLIALAGDLTTTPDMIEGLVLRRDGQVSALDLPALLAGVAAANLQLRDGDVVTLSERILSVHIPGRVEKPGGYELPAGSSVMQLLAEAGGAAERAALNRVAIQHADGLKHSVDLVQALLNGDLNGDIALADGDLVVVPEARAAVVVLGAVARPGLYEIDESAAPTVTQLIAEAGGVAQGARLTRAGVIRRTGEGTERITVNLTRVLGGGRLDEDVPVQDRDVIYVPGHDLDLDTVLRAITTVSVLGRWLSD